MSLVRRGDVEITQRYRPRRLSEIVGNKPTVKAMYKCIEMGDKRQHTLLLKGESGCVLPDTLIKVRKISNEGETLLTINMPQPDNS